MINHKITRELHNNLLLRYRKSLYIYASLTILGFALSAALVIFNLYAVRFNPAKTTSEGMYQLNVQRWMFILIAILAAVQAFMTGILTLFTFRKTAKNMKYKIERINIQIERFKNQTGDYESSERDAILINLVTKILNE